MKHLNRFLLFATLFIVIGCAATQQENATKAMLVTQTAIVDIATSAAQLCSNGVLSQPQCDDISIAYTKAKVHYDLAESALATAIESDSDDAWANYNIIHDNFTRIYSDLLFVASSYGITSEVK